MDREKVINELQAWIDDPYARDTAINPELVHDALALLKEQEAEPEIEGGGSTWWYVCSECRGAIDDSDRYCRHCGARMKGR